MDKVFFGNQVDRLRGVYSASALNEERVNIWWKQFKNEPGHVFESALNHIIAEATTQALPSMSRVVEACGMFRTNPNGAVMRDVQSPHECDPCRDFGYGFNGDTVTRCSCLRGRKISPEALAKAQKHYNAGAAFLKSRGLLAFRDLPYDPKKRGE